ncbi:MAG: hypothetical protein Q9195_000773 [Heterodermia aff. obscurata]
MSAYAEEAASREELAQEPDRSVPWYRTDIGGHLSPITREMFRVYCGLSDSDLDSHLQRIDLRRLALDGAPTDKMYASDIVPNFWDIGFDLFQDHASMKARFVQADLLDEWSALRQLEGIIEIVYVGSVLHLFGWERQLQAGKQIARLSKVGTMVFGYQIGAAAPDEIVPTWRGSKSMYSQSEETFRQLWEQAAQKTGTT